MSERGIPPYALYFRWGSFHLSLTGRRPLLAWATIIATAVGVKLLWPLWHMGTTP
jgi:hypothetical protein